MVMTALLVAMLQEIVAFCNADVINARDNKGRTALHLACGEGALESVRILLQSNKCLINSQVFFFFFFFWG